MCTQKCTHPRTQFCSQTPKSTSALSHIKINTLTTQPMIIPRTPHMHMVIPFAVLELVQSNALILCNYSSFVEILCLAYWFAPW